MITQDDRLPEPSVTTVAVAERVQRRGRPTKGERAMTPAERKRAQRDKDRKCRGREMSLEALMAHLRTLVVTGRPGLMDDVVAELRRRATLNRDCHDLSSGAPSNAGATEVPVQA